PERPRPGSDPGRGRSAALPGLLGSARYASLIGRLEVVMASAKPKPDFKALLTAVAALELLAAAAPARVVAADLVALADHPLLRRHSPAPGFERARRGDRLAIAAEQRAGSGRCDRLGAGERLVLVGDRAAVDSLRRLRPLQLVDLLHLDLGVEERPHDLLANRTVQLLEQLVPLGGVLDERVLLRHPPQVDALAEVVHV